MASLINGASRNLKERLEYSKSFKVRSTKSKALYEHSAFSGTHMSEILNQFILRVAKDNPRRETSPLGLNLMPKYHFNILRPKHPKFQELLGRRRLTREDTENGYQRTKILSLQIFSSGSVRHQ